MDTTPPDGDAGWARSSTSGTSLPADRVAHGQDLPPPNPRWVVAVTVVAIVFVAFSLRTPITSLGALLSDVRADLGLSSGLAGFLTSAPTLMFATAGAIVPWLGRHLSTRVTVTVSLVLLALGTWLRTVAGTWVLVLATLLAMAGIALVNVLLPVIVRTSFPRRQGWLTGLYVATMQIGAAVASTAAVPLARGGDGWRAGLAWWAAPAAVAIVTWLGASRVMADSDRRDRRDSQLTWSVMLRDRTAVALTVLFGTQSLAFYTVAGWLPTILRDFGLSAGQAGANMGIALTVMVPAALVTPAWVASLDDQRKFVPAVMTPWLTGMGGLLFAPTTLTWLWMVLVGIGLTSFPIALLLMGLRSASAADTKQVSAFAQGIGYLLALPGPLLFGVIHDFTGGWTVPLWLLTATIVPIAWGGWIAGRDVFIGHR